MAAKLTVRGPTWCVPGEPVRLKGRAARFVKFSLADPNLAFVVPDGERAPRQVRLADLAPAASDPKP